MHPLVFAAVLAALALAMVYAMVELSRAVLTDGRGARRWGVAYAIAWAAILGWIVLFLGEDLRANLAIVSFVPLVWLAMHAAILRLGVALRESAVREREKPRARVRIIEEEEDEQEIEEVPRVSRVRVAVQWIVTMVVALVVIGIGENIGALHRLDAALAPHRAFVITILAVLAGAGFVTFMGGIIALVLRGSSSETELGIEETHARRLGITELPPHPDGETSLEEVAAALDDGTWRDRPRMRRAFFVGISVIVTFVAATALGVVVAPPGIKLLLLVAAAYVAVRTLRGLRPRTRSPRAPPAADR